ncbi:aminotransferase class IV [Nakamurella sp.]|uniref:aminotransferase class IV n=1 Tax=Nakamurella sp. TaxID=1869182 RepID=UPI0037846075
MTDGSIAALLDGTLVDPAEPLLRPDDLGVLRGEGVFETTLVVDGHPRDLDVHLVRLAISAQATGLVVPAPDRWRAAVAAVVGAWAGGSQMVLRLIASRGPEHGEPVCYLLGTELPVSSRRQRRSGVRVLLLERGFTVDVGASAPWLLAGAKTLSYGINMSALRHARANGADDVIFIGTDGAVLEAPTSSVVVARGRTLITPPDEAILAGITVRRLFRAASAAGWPVRTERLGTADLHAADGVWLTSSARLLAPVVAIDGRPRSDGGLTGELAELLDMPAA